MTADSLEPSRWAVKLDRGRKVGYERNVEKTYGWQQKVHTIAGLGILITFGFHYYICHGDTLQLVSLDMLRI